jgi:hypothetical protein
MEEVIDETKPLTSADSISATQAPTYALQRKKLGAHPDLSGDSLLFDIASSFVYPAKKKELRRTISIPRTSARKSGRAIAHQMVARYPC